MLKESQRDRRLPRIALAFERYSRRMTVRMMVVVGTAHALLSAALKLFP
jgi:hypothetical protein